MAIVDESLCLCACVCARVPCDDADMRTHGNDGNDVDDTPRNGSELWPATTLLLGPLAST